MYDSLLLELRDTCCWAQTHTPVYLSWIKKISYVAYGYSGLVKNEFMGAHIYTAQGLEVGDLTLIPKPHKASLHWMLTWTSLSSPQAPCLSVGGFEASGSYVQLLLAHALTCSALVRHGGCSAVHASAVAERAACAA